MAKPNYFQRLLLDWEYSSLAEHRLSVPWVQSKHTHTKNLTHSISQSNQPTKISLLLENSVQLPSAKLPSAHLLPATHTKLHVSTCPPEIWLPQGERRLRPQTLIVSRSPRNIYLLGRCTKNITTLTQASCSFPGCRLTSPSPYFKHNQNK